MFRKTARQRRGDWRAEWLAKTVLLSLLPILVLVLVCWCVSYFREEASAGDLIIQAVGGGDLILWAFVLLLPSLACFTRRDSKQVFPLLLAAMIGEGALYILLKIQSILPGQTGSGYWALVISLVCGAVSILFSLLGRKRLEENRIKAEPVLSLENADAPRGEVPL